MIPAYNEEENIKSGALGQVDDYLKRQKYSWEALVVNDGSTDKTSELARDFAKRHRGFSVLNEPHRGKAGTVIAGMLKARGDIVLFADMDQATPIDQIEKFLPEFDRGADVVIGSRRGRKGAPLLRKIMAFGFVVLRTMVLRLPYRDTQTGFKAFTRDAAQEVFRRMKIFTEKQRVKGAAVNAGFDLEMLYIARKLGLKVAEAEVTWEHKGTFRVSPVKDSLRGLRDLVKVRLNAAKGRYNV